MSNQSAEFSGLSLSGLADAMASGRITSYGLTRHYLEVIQSDASDQALNALISLDPQALEQAKELDREYCQSGPRSPLHGAPIVIKDNIDLVGFPTTAGCAVLRNTRPSTDAVVVRRLREAGAVIIGKANMSEFACSNGRPGYSSAGGLTRNPHDRSRHANGSSTGSAVAVAAGQALAALGTDTFGSIRAPASVTGCIGLRPTWNLINLDGIFPLAPNFDVVGPIVRNASDLPIIMNVLIGESTKYRERLDGSALKCAKIGVPQSLPVIDHKVAAAFKNALSVIKNETAGVVFFDGFPDGEADAAPVISPIGDAEFIPSIETYLAHTPGAPATIGELFATIEGHNKTSLQTSTSRETLAMIARHLSDYKLRNSDEITVLYKRLENFRSKASHWFNQDFDVILFPTHLTVPGQAIDAFGTPASSNYNPMAISYIAPALSFPEVTVPFGHSDGMPLGLSIMGPRNSDQLLMDLAFGLQSIFKYST